MGAIKWVGGLLGWTLGGGIIGGIIGFALGSAVENMIGGDNAAVNRPDMGSRRFGDQARSSRPQTQPGDFGVSLLILSAAVMKSDHQVVKSELDYVKEFFKRQFGLTKAENYILMLRELLKQDYNLREVCLEIKLYMDHASRLQLLHFLFGLSQSDGQIHPEEIQMIQSIASWLGISSVDYESIQAMFVKNSESAYKILEITVQATDEEVKKAYKKMAIKYHPDKVSHLGEDVQKAANEKFKDVNQAYEQIKKERGIK
jgi:DnaJ like chaperone protein